MSVRTFVPAVCVLLCVPALAPAGPIQFGFSTGNVTTSPDAPALGLTLQPFQPPGAVFTYDPAGGPVRLTAVSADPTRIPTPDPRDVHPDGTTHWNNDGYFSVDVGLLDYASGASATLTFRGRAHAYNGYTAEGGWTGGTVFWFDDYQQVTLGGNTYTLWGANRYRDGPAAVNVWVGEGAPVYTPEPGTLALAALGLVPVGLRRLRRRS